MSHSEALDSIKLQEARAWVGVARSMEELWAYIPPSHIITGKSDEDIGIDPCSLYKDAYRHLNNATNEFFALAGRAYGINDSENINQR